ncbi:hypothetical protein RB195_024361 [Necator americanus]|uniref:Phlebovirus glycoprotein G2 fusion domain-containing protein n=1 Tax=Necator americanus TaxID=51031 RepID=A0ABR1EMV5_NECAM
MCALFPYSYNCMIYCVQLVYEICEFPCLLRSDPIVNCACPSGSGDQRTIHMFSRTMKCETTIPSICTYEARASEATIKNLLILSLKSIVKDIECDIIRLFGTIKSHIIMSSQSLD